jgi:hypothetical protein
LLVFDPERSSVKNLKTVPTCDSLRQRQRQKKKRKKWSLLRWYIVHPFPAVSRNFPEFYFVAKKEMGMIYRFNQAKTLCSEKHIFMASICVQAAAIVSNTDVVIFKIFSTKHLAKNGVFCSNYCLFF